MEPNQPDKDPERQGRRYNKRARQGENWLANLQLLPPPVFKEGTQRLLRGESAASVARWLLTVPDRGHMSEFEFNTLRAYVQLWRKRLLEGADFDPKRRRRLRRQWNPALQKERQRQANEIALQRAVDDTASSPPGETDMTEQPSSDGTQHQHTSMEAKLAQVHETIEAMVAAERLEDFLNLELRLSALRLKSLFAAELRAQEANRHVTAAISATTEIANALVRVQQLKILQHRFLPEEPSRQLQSITVPPAQTDEERASDARIEAATPVERANVRNVIEAKQRLADIENELQAPEDTPEATNEPEPDPRDE